ncbi:restriction endonuclease subunit S [Bifidobacterium magnum]|uniref:Type I restriction modification DNA specificity domain-containing protein n=1 Tax=Bifidobacterium magnum TaxID=1692 RepID=A0A087BEB8_9BIFI|nr:restriction endonuclease subunit S [Bifidobacterium magnum]KFI69368.1 putative Type I specificity (S) subunit of unknown recognition sequence [Bifidobacterium magnum]
MYGKLDFLHAAFGIVPPELDGFESTADSPAFNIDSSINAFFLLQSCLRKDTYLYQGSLADGSRKAKRVHANTFLNMTFNVPNKNEQDQITDLLETLSKLITAYEQKLTLLKQKKQYFLQAIFSQKLRFKGFTGPWEQHKFADLYRRKNQKNDLTYRGDKIISVANMYFKEPDNSASDSYLRTYNVFEIGDIAFEGNANKYYSHGRFVENTIGNGIVSHVFDVFKPISKEHDLLYWKYFINCESAMRKVLIRSTKSSTMMTNLVASDFLKEHVAVPSLEEQSKIGRFLKNTDDLIDAYEQKLTLLKQKKQYFLQNLFI